MSKPLHDGSKIYDTPKAGCSNAYFRGYNGGYEEQYPTYSVGSTCEFTYFWEKNLFRRLLSVLNIKMPDWWDRDYTLWVLFRCGYLGIIEGGEFGDYIPQYCTYAGRNVYYQPTRIIVANPLIKKQRYIIGSNASLIKLNPDYSGAWSIVHEFAEELGMLTQSLKMAIVNTRLVDGYATDSNASAQVIRTMLELVDKGQPAVVINSKKLVETADQNPIPWYEFHNEVGKNYIIDKLLADIERTINMFYREIGIPVMSDKKERQIQSEVNMTAGAAMTAIDTWVDTLTESIKKADKVFPGIAEKFKVSKPEYTGGEANESKVES